MKAIVVHQFGGPEELKLETVADPAPGPGQALVRMAAVGVNPVETYRRAGGQGYKPALPFTPGTDGAGTVEALGPGTKRLAKGQRVFVSGSLTGTYAELALCPEDAVQPLPERVSFQQGACVGIPYGTAYRALFQRARALPGESVLIHGATGGVGIAAVQLARAAGLRVAGTAGTARGAELVIKEGAHRVFDHRRAGYESELLAWTGDRGFDVIVEVLANVNLARDLSLLAPRGRVAVLGSRGKIEIDPRETMTRDASIVGLSLRNATPEEKAQLDAALLAGLAAGTLQPVVGREFPLEKAPEAHAALMEPGAYGKIVLRCQT